MENSTNPGLILNMVKQLMERDYNAELIAAELNTSVKRATALMAEVERRRDPIA